MQIILKSIQLRRWKNELLDILLQPQLRTTPFLQSSNIVIFPYLLRALQLDDLVPRLQVSLDEFEITVQ